MATASESTFIDFDITITQGGPGMYLTTAQTPGSGRAEGRLDWAVLSSDDFKAMVERIRDEPYTSDEALFANVGAVLFAALFNGQVRDLYVSQRAQVQANAYLRLRLDISESAPDVAQLPWEFMADNGVYLGTQVKTLLTRQLLNLTYGYTLKPLKVEDRPRVLVVIPRGSKLATDREEANITQALTDAGLPFDASKDILKGKVTLQRVLDTLARGEHHILQFIGHGSFKEQADGQLHGVLRFNLPQEDVDEAEDEEWVTDSRLLNAFNNYEWLKLVVLNACQSAVVAGPQDADRAEDKAMALGTARGFMGTAPALLRAGIPAVVAMQYRILDPVAVQFGTTFYKRLTEAGPWAGHVDIAATEARKACLANFPRDRGFATPVLYLRAPDGRLFDIAPMPDIHADHEGCPQPPQPDNDLVRKYRFSSAPSLWRQVQTGDKNINATIQMLASLRQQLDIARLANPLAVPVLEQQIAQLETSRDDAMTELEEQGQVLAWLVYQKCLELQKVQAELESLQSKPNPTYTDSKRISDLNKAVRETEELLNAARPWLEAHGLIEKVQR